MEFRLNKIDTDVRQRIEDQTKEGKVHSKKGISVQKDKKQRQGKNNDFYSKVKKNLKNKKNKIKINAVKYSANNNIAIEATKENKDEIFILKGSIIDTKK
ncbi:hypothetical protein [Clostridium niameyense]|uniref:hypothetical protein n=1 Tax=Clostridium niameyense TaxID=1622073 RepID=UPI00067EBEBA|nr:hypothetical protein [Clostridium niameyense]